MVESESFIKEVSEEVKRDKLFKVLNKFKWSLFASMVLLVGAVGGYEYYKFAKERTAQENGEFLISALENLKESGETVSTEIKNKLVAILIKLNEAKYFEEKGDIKSATTAYNHIISNYGDNRFFNDYSKFQLYLMDPAETIRDSKKIEVLDEATSSLDPRSEKRIIENLLENKTSKTLIIISHRLSSISGVDNIVVIENGRLIQQGKHDSLMQESGLYKEMWEKQKRYQNKDKRDVF